jgi:hypothetical protein
LANLAYGGFQFPLPASGAEAVEFYRHYGFIPFPDKPNRLFLPMTSIQKMFPQEAEEAGVTGSSK